MNPYQQFIQDRSLEPMSLAGLNFHVNPFTYAYSTEYLDVDIPTLGGFVHINFGNKPPTHHIQGFTGIHGRAGIDQLQFLRAIAGHTQTLVPFIYPARHGPNQVFYVYVQNFTDSISTDMHLYNQYDITLIDYGKQGIKRVIPLADSLGSSILSSITTVNAYATVSSSNQLHS